MDMGDLMGTRLFRGMDEKEIGACLAALDGREGRYDKGEMILRAGDDAREMGLMLSGRATVENVDIWGNRTLLSPIAPGDCFAETYAMLGGMTLLVDVCAATDCRALFLRAAGLRGCGAAWARKMTENLLGISLHKNLALSTRSFHTAPKSLRGRVAAYLGTVAMQRGSREFDIPFDRQELADYLSVDRSALSKELGRMRDEGIVAFRKNHFCLLKGPEE